jgi:type II secretory pathway component PulK
MDYLDEDDLRRLNGAEDEDYRRAGLPPPANAPARTGEELFRVKGWSRPDHSESELLRSSITAAPPSLAFNLNTANQAVMRVWFGLTTDEAQRVADYRATQTLTGPEHITRLTGRTIIPDDLRLYTFPGNRFRIRLLSSEASSHQVYQSWVTIAPALSDQPFFVSPSIVRVIDVVEWGSDVSHEDVDLPPLESGTGKGG